MADKTTGRFVNKGYIAQGGNDTTSYEQIATSITLNSNIAWRIISLRLIWCNGSAMAAADSKVHAVLSTTASVPSDVTWASADEIATLRWSVVFNTSGMAVINCDQKTELKLPRVTCQPILYLHVISTGTGQANILQWELEYETVDKAKLDFLELLVGGA